MRVGLLWRAEWDPAGERLRDVFVAFAELAVAAEPVVFSDDAVDRVREQLLGLDAVLVWVNPVEQGLDRSLLDPLLQEVVDAGVFVSARPDVILRLGTKKVLWDTRELSWSGDVAIYRGVEELRAELPARLEEAPRVLKQYRGMGGDGVWKVEAAAGGKVVMQHATGDTTPELLTFDQLARRLAPYGLLIEQPYSPRLADGMIRAYLTHDKVVGFTHQYPRGLMPPGPDDRPSGKVWQPPDTQALQPLRNRLESEWVPQLQGLLALQRNDLPVIWDADFFFGEADDTYVLCEINCSSTFAFPEFAMPTVARATLDAAEAGDLRE